MPSLDAIIASRHEVVCVVSQPDRRRGRGRKQSPSAVSQRALDAGLTLLRPERVGAADCVASIQATTPDVGVVVAFGQFIPKSLRALPSRGFMINAHASLLPRFRGASPIAQSILHGDSETGISVMRVEREMDAGPVALMKRTPIDPMENVDELSERLSQMAADALLEALELIENDRVEWTEQDHAAASHAPKIEKRDGRIDWQRPAAELVRHIHGHAPKPGAFGLLESAGSSQSLRILRARACDDLAGASDAAAPGTLYLPTAPDGPTLLIATGHGWLVPLEVQRSGGKAMAIDAFLRGHPLSDDARFSLAPAPGDAGQEGSP